MTLHTIAKLFQSGRNQAARLAATLRDQVFVRRDGTTGGAVLRTQPLTWDGFFEALAKADVPADFLDASERAQGPDDRDCFSGAAPGRTR